jgi:hypothetical protein
MKEQMICVVHEYDMVVVCTGYSEIGPMNSKDGPGPIVIRNFLIPSIKRFEEDTTAGINDYLGYYALIFVATSIPIISTIIVAYALLKKEP